MPRVALLSVCVDKNGYEDEEEVELIDESCAAVTPPPSFRPVSRLEYRRRFSIGPASGRGRLIDYWIGNVVGSADGGFRAAGVGNSAAGLAGNEPSD